MGILNLTPDSFSDGGQFFEAEAAYKHAVKMIDEGADIIDLGGESTRPGASELPPDDEVRRVMPVLSRLHRDFPTLPLSIDTRHSETAAIAIGAGAMMVNDISALSHDPGMAALLARHPQVKVILMHMQGSPQTMQDKPWYEDLLAEISDFFAERISYCASSGIAKERLMLDPGIGFGKNMDHNLCLLANLSHFKSFGLPLVLGASRKRFIDAVHPSAVEERLPGSLASAYFGALQGVDIIRVHDVASHLQFFKVMQAIQGAQK